MSTSKLLLRFAKPYPGWILLTILLGFSGSLFNGVGTALIVPVILKIVGQEVNLTNAPPVLKVIMTPFDSIPESYRIWVMTGAIIATIILKNFATYASTLASSSLTRMLTSDMREAGILVLLQVDIDYYSKTRVGDLINSLGGEIARAASAIGNVIKTVIVAITILVFIALLLSISWQLTLASTVLLSFVTLVNQFAISRSKDFGHQLSEMSKAYSIAVLEALSGIRLVKATGNEDREYERIKQLIRARERADFESQIYSEAIAPLSEVTGITALLLIVLLSRTLFANQLNSLSTVLLTYLLVLLRLIPFISQMNILRSSFANTSSSVALITDFLSRDNKPLMKQGDVYFKELHKGVHFNHISFAYPSHEKLVLKDVDLFLPRGTTLALVGSSGAGKSTIADLLPRFYDPISGCITIDGVDLREFSIKSLRQAMGIVSQETFLFNDSVRNNIAYGRPEATEEDIIIAAKRANAYEFISKLSQGFDTLIGDRGVMLSGGQRQRLAIARALLQDPEILILDEATSALDTVSERLVQAAIDDLSRDRTTLVIAHRLSTVQKAHQIAVLEQGHVVEVGTHAELLQKGGYYSRLYSMQFAEQAEAATKAHHNLLRLSLQMRTRLNSIIGSLRLLLDPTIDNLEERRELIAESHKSTVRLFNSIDVFEDNATKETSSQICDDLRTYIEPTLTSLSSLVDNSIDTPTKQNELAQMAYDSAIKTMGVLSEFENSLKD
ncbi:ABC transporter ATP-binding protein/permease [Aetokthonos hydrillicola Thurmond2011]|jgi:subfamily B ATP-binding cassette protein MsbA|uniref:ABC transporter ATP-binding protein/permease n=1 Tax=Aetokthonos hydrillicola Thurmond2011 TaxID=2712845 RepID=A0AAP5ID64_9CYAN|nr:ABC transporter ATP-binding protein [Aetokthonos hydrillicola]MBO3461926.1 ABC transporter ATP-binding protein [Aetokthonos hydrillicola CCALA 1050]MBW4585409.1 ABC transporter ATP-binding protein/permease [Aetokthonos hydrillicola CCALA 1050]MDR9899084.1 ABC transporter ATP-binding protein/permease [Aetokthonos hydrillicola Thurmond2011]